MRNKLRNMYEKNNKTLYFIYYFLKCVFIVLGKYRRFKVDTKEAIDSYEPKKLNKIEHQHKFKKLIVFRYIYRLMPGEYYSYDFEKVPYDKRDSYITRQLTKKYYAMINTKKYRKILDKKNLTYEVFGKYYKRDMLCIKDETEFNKFEEFASKHKKFILKPLAGHSGVGVEIINTKDYDSLEDLFAYCLERAPFVTEELIVQDKGLGCFHENSVNTIRVVTFYYKNDVSIVWTFLRTGQGESNVDNMGASGLGALINPATGVIMTDGFDWHNKKTKVHPDSGVVFKGYQIPRWDELLDMVKSLASEISEMHCIGWDLSLTDKGWVLVEGNARPQVVAVQTFSGKGYKPIFDKMYNLVKREVDEKDRIMRGE